MTFKTPCGLALFLSVVVPDGVHACETQLSHTTRVVEIIDGQTVRLDDGNVVRLMGALAPEAPPWWKGPGEWPPLKRSRTGLADLLQDKQIEVRFAGSEAKRDRHEHQNEHGGDILMARLRDFRCLPAA